MVSSVSPPPAFTRLPTVTWVRLALPAIGAIYLGEVEVEPGLLHGCLGFEQFGFRDGLLAQPYIDLFPAGRPRLQEGGGPLVLLLGQFQAGLGAGNLCLCRVQSRLVRPWVDLEKHVARLDHLPIVEVDLDQMPANAGPHLD